MITKKELDSIKKEFQNGWNRYRKCSIKRSNKCNHRFFCRPNEYRSSRWTKETQFQQTKWADYYGYYRSIPELAIAIDTRATWTVGKGYKGDDFTKFLLDSVKGNGDETFNTILENMIRTMWIAGDSYAEIMTNEEGFF